MEKALKAGFIVSFLGNRSLRKESTLNGHRRLWLGMSGDLSDKAVNLNQLHRYFILAHFGLHVSGHAGISFVRCLPNAATGQHLFGPQDSRRPNGPSPQYTKSH